MGNSITKIAYHYSGVVSAMRFIDEKKLFEKYGGIPLILRQESRTGEIKIWTLSIMNLTHHSFFN